MVRAIGAFLLLFSLLSLIVHQNGMFLFLAGSAAAILAIDGMIEHFSKGSGAAGNAPPVATLDLTIDATRPNFAGRAAGQGFPAAPGSIR